MKNKKNYKNRFKNMIGGCPYQTSLVLWITSLCYGFGWAMMAILSFWRARIAVHPWGEPFAIFGLFCMWRCIGRWMDFYQLNKDYDWGFRLKGLDHMLGIDFYYKNWKKNFQPKQKNKPGWVWDWKTYRLKRGIKK